jgi:hypothetical protein
VEPFGKMMPPTSRIERKEIPWCTLCLVTACVTCHTSVLVGNIDTSSALTTVGKSTSGWSAVGVGLATAMEDELESLMTNCSDQMVDVLEQIVVVQEMMDYVLAWVGNSTDEAVNASGAVALLQTASAAQKDTNITELAESLKPVIMSTLDSILDKAMEYLSGVMYDLLDVIKPALEQVGEWIEKFTDRIIDLLESFSTTIDKVQKVFDNLMSQLSTSGGDNAVAMLNQVISLFDVDGDGCISLSDIEEVAEIYSITCLQGDKPAELFPTYDTDDDGCLDWDELFLFTEDDDIPNAMSVILRAYAKKLSVVAGEVAGATMRIDVADAVVDYFELVCAKNMTKLYWVSDAISNMSLPLDFTSAVMASLCLAEDDPNLLTDMDVGATVIDAMYQLNEDYLYVALDNMADEEFWVPNGYSIYDLARCTETVTGWVLNASLIYGGTDEGDEDSDDNENSNESSVARGLGLAQMGRAQRRALTRAGVRQQAELRVQRYHARKRDERSAKREAMFGSKTSQRLLGRLLGGVAASDSTNPNADSLINGGQPAYPETLLFAAWLSSNASASADKFQEMCFEYSQTSSSTLDSFATEIQGLIKEVVSMITILETWASDTGIARIEEMVEDFATTAMEDVKSLVLTQISDLIDDYLPEVAEGVVEAVDSASESIGTDVADFLGDYLEEGLIEPVAEIAGELLDNETWGEEVAETVVDSLIGTMDDALGSYIGDQLKDVLEELVVDAVSEYSSSSESVTGQRKPLKLLQADQRRAPEEIRRDRAAARTEASAKKQALLQLPESTCTGRSGAVAQCERRHARSQKAALAQHAHVEKKDAKRRATEELMHRTGGGQFGDLMRFHSGHKGRAGGQAGHASSGSEHHARGHHGSSHAGRARARTAGRRGSTTTGVEISDAWETAAETLATLIDVVPTGTDTMTLARDAVGAAAECLASIFSTFADDGEEVFDEIAFYWTLIWALYFGFMAPMTCVILFYGFWAGGYFGGPQPSVEEEYVPPRTVRDRVGVCASTCGICCQKCHDSKMCFWSLMIVMQIVILIIFLISIILCIFAGVKTFIIAGCSEIYMLSDETTCLVLIEVLKSFLTTFYVSDISESLDEICDSNKLLTCDLIEQKMITSTILTTIFSFAAVILGLQLCIESACLHEKVRFRRALAEAKMEADFDETRQQAALTS